jgi:hypothetical protein
VTSPDLPSLMKAAVRHIRLILGSTRGQTTAEWLLLAGLLTAMAVILSDIAFDSVRRYTLSLIYPVRTFAP